jgi:hypothetical protein
MEEIVAAKVGHISYTFYAGASFYNDMRLEFHNTPNSFEQCEVFHFVNNASVQGSKLQWVPIINSSFA